MRAALQRAQGAYALAVIHKGEPDRVVGARMNVPLIVGLGEGEAFLASDVAAVLAHTRRVIYLEEGDVADLGPGRVTITDMVGRRLERPVREVDWDIEAAEKGGYEHFMLKEMHEQPEAILAAITGRIHGQRIRVPELAPLGRTRLADHRAHRAGGLRQRGLRLGRGQPGAAGLDGPAGSLEHRLRVPLRPAAAG